MTCNGPISEDPAPDLAQLTSRQETFARFPNRCPVSSSDLARAGFFYTGEGDQVRCFSCLATLEGWEEGDSVVGRHKIVSPNCPFIHNANFEDGRLLSGLPNGPPGREAAATTTSVPTDSDLSSDFEADYLLRTRQVVDLSGSPYPQNPAMCNEEVRLRSFTTGLLTRLSPRKSWPTRGSITEAWRTKWSVFVVGEVEKLGTGGPGMVGTPSAFPEVLFVLGHDVGNVGNVTHQPGDGQLERSNTHRVPPLLPPPPHNPSMADFAKRLQTFGAWSYSVSKERLAQAGFYSLGVADGVECFSCGGGLKEWKAGEDPWEEHARWYPGCKYLGEEKGQAFVNGVHLKSLPLESNTEEPEKVLTIEDEKHLQSRAIQSALQMGFSAEEISQTVERKERLSAERYQSVEALVTDLINAQRDNTPSAHIENHLQKDLSTEEKLKRLEEEKLCKICMDKLLSVVFIPCGHLACQQCAEAVEKCPWCCKIIANRQKVFMP